MKKNKFVVGVVAIFSACLLFLSCTSESEKKQTEQEILLHQSATQIHEYLKILNQKQDDAITEFINGMSLEQKIGQLFIENLQGNEQFRTFEESRDISKNDDTSPLVAGGYLFFSANLAPSADGVMNFTNSIFAYCKKNNLIPPFLAIDQEGGFVNRLRGISGPLPSCQRVSECLNLEQAAELYELQAKQMELLGFNMNLAPVAEVCTSENSIFLNGRSFGDVNQVKEYGKICLNAYQNNHISTVLKHFPGNTNTDPHTGLPEIQLSKDELQKSLEPFYYLIEANPHGILMSHARTSAYNPELPSCLSDFWITKVLREQCGYKGLIFSDDIFMAALAKNGYPPEKAVVMAIQAGIDCIMTSEKRIAKPAAYLYKEAVANPDFEEIINQAVRHVVLYKMELGFLEYRYDFCDEGERVSLEIAARPVNSPAKLPMNERVEAFEELRQKNVQFYMEHFY